MSRSLALCASSRSNDFPTPIDCQRSSTMIAISASVLSPTFTYMAWPTILSWASATNAPPSRPELTLLSTTAIVAFRQKPYLTNAAGESPKRMNIYMRSGEIATRLHTDQRLVLAADSRLIKGMTGKESSRVFATRKRNLPGKIIPSSDKQRHLPERAEKRRPEGPERPASGDTLSF
jgi:hypothetical protein